MGHDGAPRRSRIGPCRDRRCPPVVRSRRPPRSSTALALTHQDAPCPTLGDGQEPDAPVVGVVEVRVVAPIAPGELEPGVGCRIAGGHEGTPRPVADGWRAPLCNSPASRGADAVDGRGAMFMREHHDRTVSAVTSTLESCRREAMEPKLCPDSRCSVRNSGRFPTARSAVR